MKRDKPSKLVRWLFWLGVILVLSWIFLWSGFSFYKVWKIDRQVKHLERELSQTQAQNDSLRRENYRLKTDPAAAEEMLRCQAEVLLRLPAGTAIRCLSAAAVGELLNWDAEKFRQRLAH